ncbi:MAG: PPK2 family polyphosphate kinase [Verrucomicrobiota bacterium]
MSKSLLEKFQVAPGSQVRLSEIAGNDQSAFPELDKKSSAKVLEGVVEELRALQRIFYAVHSRKILVVIQAMDAGGKDGTVRHVFSHMDAHGIHITSFKKPTEEELDHDFLWRIHKHAPKNGHIAVFNRSHYEDIIAVRVKKLFPDEVWQRRYQHVIDFERMLAEEGTIILKLFLHISKDEQRDRLAARLTRPDKLWKFEPDDLKDRARWDDFQRAYEDLIGQTSKPHAPWFIIPADRKWYRNLVIAHLLKETLEGMNLEYPQPHFDPSKIRID